MQIIRFWLKQLNIYDILYQNLFTQQQKKLFNKNINKTAYYILVQPLIKNLVYKI